MVVQHAADLKNLLSGCKIKKKKPAKEAGLMRK